MLKGMIDKENKSVVDRELLSELMRSPIHPFLINKVRSYIHMWEARWPLGQCARFRIEQFGFEPWPGILCCVLEQDTLRSQCLSPPRCVNGYRRTLMVGVNLRWTSIPSRGEQKKSQSLYATETKISSGQGHCFVFLGKTLTLTVPLSTQAYKQVPANLMVGVTLRWNSFQSCGEQKYRYSQSLHATETG